MQKCDSNTLAHCTFLKQELSFPLRSHMIITMGSGSQTADRITEITIGARQHEGDNTAAIPKCRAVSVRKKIV